MFDLKMPSLEVDLVIVVEGHKYNARGKVSVCPFCDNLEGDKEVCGLCLGNGILIKLIRPLPGLKLRVIPGGKKD